VESKIKYRWSVCSRRAKNSGMISLLPFYALRKMSEEKMFCGKWYFVPYCTSLTEEECEEGGETETSGAASECVCASGLDRGPGG
jgi:hypothetical protein